MQCPTEDDKEIPECTENTDLESMSTKIISRYHTTRSLLNARLYLPALAVSAVQLNMALHFLYLWYFEGNVGTEPTGKASHNDKCGKVLQELKHQNTTSSIKTTLVERAKLLGGGKNDLWVMELLLPLGQYELSMYRRAAAYVCTQKTPQGTHKFLTSFSRILYSTGKKDNCIASYLSLVFMLGTREVLSSGPGLSR